GAWRLNILPPPSTPFLQALYLAGICVLLVVFALLRGWVQGLLTRLVFRSPDRDGLMDRLKIPGRDESSYLASAALALGEFMGTEASLIENPRLSQLDLRRPALISELAVVRAELEKRGAEVVVPIRLSSGASQYILLGRRSG